SAVQKVQAHLEETPRPLSEIRPEVPAGLVQVVERMLAKDPAQRFQTPAAVARALAPWTGEQTTPPSDSRAAVAAQASPSPTPPRPRRRRRLVLLLAAATAAVVVAVAVALAPLVVGLAQTTIRIATNKGELVIDNDDEDIEVTIKQPGHEPV